MNRFEFIAQLKNKLRSLPAEEIANAAAYYEEYFDDAGPENEQSVIAELGSPSGVASKIIGEFAIKKVDDGKGTTKAGLSAIWVVVLGIFASPIALPLAIAVVAVVFALIVTIFAVLFALGATAVALVLGGIVTFAVSVVLLFSDFATAMFFIGAALLMIACGLIIFIPIGFLSKTAITGIARGMAKILKRGK